jgi:hypothetical protein
MSEPAAMDHVQPNWVPLYRAPLVLRLLPDVAQGCANSDLSVKHLIDDMVCRFAGHGCRGCRVTDAGIEISFFNATKGRYLR